MKRYCPSTCTSAFQFHFQSKCIIIPRFVNKYKDQICIIRVVRWRASHWQRNHHKMVNGGLTSSVFCDSSSNIQLTKQPSNCIYTPSKQPQEPAITGRKGKSFLSSFLVCIVFFSFFFQILVLQGQSRENNIDSQSDKILNCHLIM